jgi:hypothetical protein
MDDDPMAFLNAQREKLAAMSEMASVAAAAGAAMHTVAARMEHIAAIEAGQVKVLEEDKEVDYWKKKIAELSSGGPPKVGDKPPPPVLKSSIMMDSRAGGGREDGRSSKDRARKSGIQRPGNSASSSSYAPSSSVTGSTSAPLDWNRIDGGGEQRGGGSATGSTTGVTTTTTRISKSKLTEYNPSRRGEEQPASGGEIRRKKTSTTPVLSRTRKDKPQPTRTPPDAPSHPVVASVEAKIRSMNRAPINTIDPEVEFWKQKIAALSAVNPTSSYTSPLRENNVFSPTNPKGSAMDAVRMRRKSGDNRR